MLCLVVPYVSPSVVIQQAFVPHFLVVIEENCVSAIILHGSCHQPCTPRQRNPTEASQPPAMGSAFSRLCGGRLLSILSARPSSGRRAEEKTRAQCQDDDDDDTLDGLVRSEDMARFPYVEFTGRDSITCPTCQGGGRIPSGQVNELVALIPYTDQRLQPQRTKFYVVLSTVLCFLASLLVAFFLFPRSVIVMDDGIRTVTVYFDPPSSKVQMTLTSTLNFSNPNFFSVLVQSVNCQVLYMKKVIGTHHLNNVTTILPLSRLQVNYTVSVEIGSSAPYVYAFCTMRSIKVHNIVVFMQTSVKTSHMVRTSQNSLEAYHYVNCGSNTTYQQWHSFSAHRHHE